MENTFDIAVIGGGIAGASTAREASSRGLSVILFEKNTFGSATSSKSSKLIHGGLRYLETAWFAMEKGRFKDAWKNFAFVCSSLRESKTLARAFPELVKPISMVVPFYPSRKRNHSLMVLGCIFYGFLGKILSGSRFPKILWSRQAVLKEIPQLLPEGLSGGVILWDHTADDHALVNAVIQSAVQKGAQCFERAKVSACEKTGDIYKIQTVINAGTKSFSARVVVNATGPWADETRRALQPGNHEDMVVPVAGSHLEFKQFINQSMALEAEDGRLFFVINKNGISRVGTTERPEPDPENTRVSEAEIDYLLKELTRLFPGISLSRQDIIARDCGIRPLAKPAQSLTPHEISREHVIQKSSDGVYHLIGVKITDHRRAAAELLSRIGCRGKTES